MTATVISIPVAAPMMCSACGSAAIATCNCGAPYFPAGMRAAKAVAANPQKSDRAIADEIGVGSNTVRRARMEAAPDGAVDARIGLDGKTRRLPARPAEAEPGIEDDIEDPANYRTAYLLRAEQAVRFAAYSGPITNEIAAVARQVAAAWSKLADKLERTI